MSTLITTTLQGLEKLKELFVGRIYLPEDEGFAEAHSAWNVAIRHTPRIVAVAETVADVQLAVRFANENDLKIAVQTTGHGQPRTCDGLLINLKNLKGVSVDIASGIAKIDGGATWIDVFPAAAELGLAPLSGSSPHVGVVGYTMGGGFGLMMRKYGLAIDSVQGFEIVTATSEVVHASREQNKNLFWAVLGGGGAFGIITRIDVQLHRQPEIYGGACFYPADRMEEVLKAYATWSANLPVEITATIDMMNFPPMPMIPEPMRGKQFAIFIATSTAPENESVELLAPMRNLGNAVLDTFHTMPYSECACIYNDPVDPLPAQGAGVLLSDFTAEDAAKLTQALGDFAASPNLKVELRQLGGAYASDGEGCLGHRDAKYLIYMLGVPMLADPTAIHAQQEAVFAALGDHVIARGPLNFIGEGDIKRKHVEGLFDSECLARLNKIKQTIDPGNRFAYAGLGIED